MNFDKSILKDRVIIKIHLTIQYTSLFCQTVFVFQHVHDATLLCYKGATLQNLGHSNRVATKTFSNVVNVQLKFA